ncbi:MAG: dihydrodipicolinate synthase family protein [Thermoprotei archaeon]
MHVKKLKQYKGVITALITPITKEMDVDSDALKTLIEFQIKNGIIGFFILGTYGEGIVLHPEKRKKFAERVVEETPTNVLLINNVSSPSIELSIELIKHSRDLGIENIASLPPLYYKVGSKEIIEFYKALSKHDCNVFVYNNPSKTNIDISPSLLSKLIEEEPSLVGIKDSTGKVERVSELTTKEFMDKLYITIASDALILDAFLYGADAHTCGLCNAFPELGVLIHKHVMSGDISKAVFYQRMLSRIRSIAKNLGYEGLAVAKAILNMRGLRVGNPIPPNRAVNDKDLEFLREVVENICEQTGIEIQIGV